MALTMLKVAAIASIILVIAGSACAISGIFVLGATGIQVYSMVALTLRMASTPIIVFSHKLDLQRSWFHAICQWTFFVSWGVFWGVQSVYYYQHQYYVLFVIFGIHFIFWIMSAVTTFKEMVAAAPSIPARLSTDIQDQQPDFFFTPTKYDIWINFVCVIVFLIFFCVGALSGTSIAGTTVCAVMSVILALLAVSTLIVATTPLSVNDMVEPLAPQEDTAATIIHGKTVPN